MEFTEELLKYYFTIKGNDYYAGLDIVDVVTGKAGVVIVMESECGNYEETVFISLLELIGFVYSRTKQENANEQS